MSPAGFALGIDFGTSSTVALLRWPDGRVKALLFDSSPLLPSAVFATPDGSFEVGADALHRGRFAPACLERNPKRRVDEETVLLGEREVTVTDLFAAVLRRVAAEATKVTGPGRPPVVALAHPAGWGPVRRLVLADAAKAAGLADVRFVPEPVAAAHYFTGALGHEVAAGYAVVVYDFGAGTFDASVVRRAGSGFEVVAVDGLDDVGGLDVDAAVVDWLRRTAPGAAWNRLSDPRTTADARERLLLWDDVRAGKEMLSRTSSITLHPPLLDTDVPLSRTEFDEIARPLVERTVRTTAGLVRHAGVPAGRIAGLFLVGGSSRIPLAASALHRAFGIAPTVTEQPELVVAEGALHWVSEQVPARLEPDTVRLPVVAAPAAARSGPAHPGPLRPAAAAPAAVRTAPPPPPPRPVSPAQPYLSASVAPPRRRGRTALAVVTVLAMVVLLGAAGLYFGIVKFAGFGTGASTGPGSKTASATGTGPSIPAGWRLAIQDGLRSPGQWSPNDDAQNGARCTVETRLTVVRTGPGTYRCKGPTTGFTDVAVYVDVILLTPGACAGVWFRFGTSASATEAGYLLKVCENGFSLATHGLQASNTITTIKSTFGGATARGARMRVGLVVRGDTMTVYRAGSVVGQVSDSTFSTGRVSLGIVAPGASGTPGENRVAFSDIEIWAPAS
jgi:hypothetical protein